MNRGIMCLAVLITSLSAGLAQAQWYVGAGYGSFKDKDWWVDRTSATHVFGGYEVNQYFAGELSYLKTGNVTCCGYDGGAYTFLTPWLVGKLPFGKFSLFAKAGYSKWTLNDDYEDQDSWDVLTGYGVQYDFSDNFGLRLEAQQAKLEYDDGSTYKGKVSTSVASFVYKF